MFYVVMICIGGEKQLLHSNLFFFFLPSFKSEGTNALYFVICFANKLVMFDIFKSVKSWEKVWKQLNTEFFSRI